MSTSSAYTGFASGGNGQVDLFARRLADDGRRLERSELSTLQLNLGKMCNLACHHCHVEAGPQRTEIMSWDTMRKVLDWFDLHRGRHGIRIADMTGGAPEMNPRFRDLVHEFRQRDVHVLDRCNLTIFTEEGYEDLVEFLAAEKVEIVASLPCYLEQNVDKQRGSGVFRDSIAALEKLNAAGYGREDSDLKLDLVFNPVDYALPPDQAQLEADYKKHLLEAYGIVFNRLWTITNMPIRRFEHALRRDGMYETYMQSLLDAHDPANVEGVMCRSLISVGWQGSVYDCDFNQMLQMPLDPRHFGPEADEHVVESGSRKLWEYKPDELLSGPVRTGNHCFGCTAGAGSSCTGALRGG
jgi:radical SAM/Cys-rich protein